MMLPLQPSSLSHIANVALEDVRYYLTVIEPVLYQAPLEVLSGSTIGQHTRHIIEFYNCLIEQCEGKEAPVINYAKRKRDYRIETAPDYAIRMVTEISQKVTDLDPAQNCQLDCDEHGSENECVSSTIGRELIYNIEHTIHHLAIIKIALKTALPSLELPAHFGVAPSTIRYRQEACAQ